MISEALLDKLKDRSLVLAKARIGNIWASKSDNDRTFEVTNPSTGEMLAILPDMARPETARAIDSAQSAQREWARLTGKERAAILRKLYDLVVENADDLAIILTMEMGKPLAESRGEILYGAAYIEWFAEEAKRVYGDTIPGHQQDKRIIVIKQPVGVVGALELPKCHARKENGSCPCCWLRNGFETCSRNTALGHRARCTG